MKKWLLYLTGGAIAVYTTFLLMGANIGTNIAPQIYSDTFTYTTNSTKTDTSVWYSLGGAAEVDLSAYYAGSASSTFTPYVIGKFYGGAEKLIYTGGVCSTAAIYSISLRNLDTNKLGAVEQVKIGYTVINGSGDSTALLKFYSNILCR
jgi:hypothetical protein